MALALLHGRACLGGMLHAGALLSDRECDLVAGIPSTTMMTCRGCGKEFGNAGARANHENACTAACAHDRALVAEATAHRPTSESRADTVVRNLGVDESLSAHEQRCVLVRRLRAERVMRVLGGHELLQLLRGSNCCRTYESQVVLWVSLSLVRVSTKCGTLAGITLRDATRNKCKARVLGNSFATPEEAALCIARAGRDLEAGRPLPFF